MPYKKRQINETFGRNLKKFREQRGITQDALAEELGITKATVSKYEHGKSTAPVTLIFELAQKYGVKPELFVENITEKEG